MKVKLYKKFVKQALKVFKYKRSQLFGNKEFKEFVAHPIVCDEDGNCLSKNQDELLCIGKNCYLSIIWKDFGFKKWYEKRYARYSRRWWTSEAKLLRSIKGEKD